MTNGGGVQLRFKDEGKYIAIIKDGKLTRTDIIALINEAQKRDMIVDLSGRNLSGLDLSRLSLGRANISNVDLSGANLSNSTLFNANLSHSNLSGANLTYTDFSYVNLSTARIVGSSMANAILFKTVLS